MIDSHFRSFWQRHFLDPIAEFFVWLRIKPNYITVMAIVCGLLCALFLSLGEKGLACFSLILSGLLDATDGTVARRLTISSDCGCILDIAGDRLVEAAVVLGLFLYEPNARGLPSLILLSSFYLCVTTFLLSGIFEKNQTNKSFHYSPGLIERTETLIFFLVVIIWDQIFYWGAILFAALVTMTAIIRMFEMLRNFSSNHAKTSSIIESVDKSV